MGLGVIDFFPVVSMLAPPWHLQPGYLSEVKGAELDIRFAWEDGERIEIRRYRTPVGEVAQKTRIDPAYGSDWVTKHYIERPEDYRVLRYLTEHTVLRRQDAAFEAGARNLGSDGVMLARLERSPFQKLLVELAGPERFLLDLYTQPEEPLALLEALARKSEEAFAMACDSSADILWQPDNVTAELTPPDCFRRYLAPFYERCVAAARQAGKVYLVHMDGRLKPLRKLIAGSPIHGIESFSSPETAGDMTIAEAATTWPGKVLLPNFPASLCHQPAKDTEAFLERCRSAIDQDVPLALQFSEDLPMDRWNTTVELVLKSLRG